MKTKTRPCVGGCGTQMPVGPRGGGRRRCYECGKAAMMKNVDQMRRRSGPAWDVWKAAMREAANRLA